MQCHLVKSLATFVICFDQTMRELLVYSVRTHTWVNWVSVTGMASDV